MSTLPFIAKLSPIELLGAVTYFPLSMILFPTSFINTSSNSRILIVTSTCSSSAPSSANSVKSTLNLVTHYSTILTPCVLAHHSQFKLNL